MNIFSRAFCRIFQKCFHLAIPLLPYRTPKILESVKDVPSEFKKMGVKNVFIVTDEFIGKSHGMSLLRCALEQHGINYLIYDKTHPNPTVSDVETARQMYVSGKCDGIIGFGGGSAMDCAKAVGARIARPKKSIEQMEGILGVVKKIPPLCAIPTTAGTGSETTVTFVITDDKTHHKFPVSDFPMIPLVAVLDPENTRTLPQHLTATTGMDALTHAVEAYIGKSTTRQSRKNALDAIKLVSENLINSYKNGDDMNARRNMLYASFYAGAAFSKSYVGYCHAVAHSLGGKYNTPHGLANAVLLPKTLELYGKSAYKKLKKVAIAFGVADKNTDKRTAAENFIGAVYGYNEILNIPKTLPEVKAKDIPSLSKLAAKEANPIYPVPKLMNAKEIEKIYLSVCEEKEAKQL